MDSQAKDILLEKGGDPQGADQLLAQGGDPQGADFLLAQGGESLGAHALLAQGGDPREWFPSWPTRRSPLGSGREPQAEDIFLGQRGDPP